MRKGWGSGVGDGGGGGRESAKRSYKIWPKGLACMENYCCRKFLFTGSTPSVIDSETPLPFRIPAASLPRVGLGRRSPREVPLLQGPLQLPPSFAAQGRGGGSESPGLLPRAERLEMGQWRVLKAEGARVRERGGVCFGPRPGMQKRGGGGSGGQWGQLAAPAPLPGRVA